MKKSIIFLPAISFWQLALFLNLFLFPVIFFNLIAQQANPEDEFSIINIYRQKSGGGGSTQYRIHFNDRLIHIFQTGSRISYKMFSAGTLKIKTDAVILGNTMPGENVFDLPVEPGKTYYLQLSNKNINYVSETEGKADFNELSQYKNELIYKEEDKLIPILSMPEPKERKKEPAELSGYRGGGDPLKGLNVSKPKEMKIGNYFALIIGIDKYSGYWPPLKNAVNDAVAIEDLLLAKYKFQGIKTLVNEQATRKAILQELESLVAKAKEEDNVLIYYSGHGQYKQELNKGFWVPVDANTNSTSDFISNSDIQTFLGGIKSKHTLLISDACFSGDIFRGSTVSVPFEESERYYTTVHNLVSRQALTSGSIEPVMDGGRDGHSVFAYYVLKILNGNNSKFLDASQLYENIKIPVMNNSEQTPNFNAIKNSGDEGGQFIFIKK